MAHSILLHLKPVVMALHGTTFGGRLEVAMGGHYRVIAPSGQVGQPEVKIGLIPGAAGTQRLPRLAGIPKALEMCAMGEPISAPEALHFGRAWIHEARVDAIQHQRPQ